MFRLIPSRYPHTIAVEIEGKATGEDAKMLDQHVKENFNKKESFNVFAMIRDLDGTTVKGLLEGPKFDAKHWNQFRKFAILSEKKWVKNAVKTGDYLPGVTTKHFNKDEIEEAWNWLNE